jgi:hypothetical protein
VATEMRIKREFSVGMFLVTYVTQELSSLWLKLITKKGKKMGIYFSLQKMAEAFLDHCVMRHFFHEEVGSYNT